MYPCPEEIFLNQTAQGIFPFVLAQKWFNSLTDMEKRKILKFLHVYCIECHPLRKEIEQAIFFPGLKPTYTPCVLIKKENFHCQINKILNLPDYETEKVFLLLFSIFSIADHRRREKCEQTCSHWWHHLGDSKTIQNTKDWLNNFPSVLMEKGVSGEL